MNFYFLDGCAPTPLAHYLKALGILRLVAEQADPGVRGWWERDRFRLMTRLDGDELLRFFLEQYEPTPLVAPWNKGSGFFYKNDPGITPVEVSHARRFARLRDGIEAARSLLDELSNADQLVRAIKNETKNKNLTRAQKEDLKKSDDYKKRLSDAERIFKARKADLIPHIRMQWRGPHREWMDAAMVLSDDGTPKFPALLGTGGNDGRLDFTNNFFQRLNDVFDLADPVGVPRASAKSWFESALMGNVTPNLASITAGQYFPGFAGGANNGNGPTASTLLNPVDYLLMLEGAILFSAHATRRLGKTSTSRASAPFAVSSQGAAYATAAEADEDPRGEQWMPLWSQPLSLLELKRLLAEGRTQIGARSVREPLDFARAVARLGTARGITSFQRYGYIERNGQNKFAVPLGRFVVPDRINPYLSCLDDLDTWLPHLRRAARDAGASSRFKIVERQFFDALFAVSQRPNEPGRWQTVLLAMTAIEAVQITGSGYRAGPIPKLRPEWVAAADDGTPEFRLALSFALQAGRFKGTPAFPVDAIRRHWLPLDTKMTWKYSTSGSGGQNRLQTNPGMVIKGRLGKTDAIALVERRLVEAAQRGERRLPLQAAPRTAAGLLELSLFISGFVDIDRTLALGRALMALDHRQWSTGKVVPQKLKILNVPMPDDGWIIIRLAVLPWPLPDGRRIGADPAILRYLVSGNAGIAIDLALRRLNAAGIKSVLRTATVSSDTARRWAAALVFPITQSTAVKLLRRIEIQSKEENVL